MSGDEAALDMFNWKKGKGQMRLPTSMGPQEANCFFIGGNMGKHIIVSNLLGTYEFLCACLVSGVG